MTIETRIRRLEDQLGVKDEEPHLAIICLFHDETKIPHFPEPVQEWVTCRAAYVEAKRSHQSVLTFTPDPYAEYEVRHDMKPGTLASHPLRGQVSFAELLGAATATERDVPKLREEQAI